MVNDSESDVVFEWFAKVTGLKEQLASSSIPMAIVTSQDGTPSIQPLPAGFKMPKGPAGDKVLIDQIMADK